MLKQLTNIYQESLVNAGGQESLLPLSDIYTERWLAAAALLAWQRSGSQGIPGVLPPLAQQGSDSRFYASVAVLAPTGRKKFDFPRQDDLPPVLCLHGLAGNLTLDRDRCQVKLNRNFGLIAMIEAILDLPIAEKQKSQGAFWHKVLWLVDLLHNAGYRGGAQVRVYVCHPSDMHLTPDYFRLGIEERIPRWAESRNWPGYLIPVSPPPMARWQDVLHDIEIVHVSWSHLAAAIPDPTFREFYQQWQRYSSLGAL